MLEELAHQYINLPGQEMRELCFAFFALGALVAAVTRDDSLVLRRAPYFAYLALIFLLMSAAQFVWLLVLEAIASGLLWALAGFSIFWSVALGYFYGVLAMARSRDAFGNRFGAILGFIPVANLVLFFKGSKEDGHAGSTGPLFHGGAGVLSGLVMFGVSMLLGVILQMQMAHVGGPNPSTPPAEESGSQSAQEGDANSAPVSGTDFIQGSSAEMANLVKTQGLIKTLSQIAALTHVPQTLDEVTTLKHLEADGTLFRLIYEVAVNETALDEELQAFTVQKNCTAAPVGPLLKAGAIFEHIYKHMDGSLIGSFKVGEKDCAPYDATKQNTTARLVPPPGATTGHP